MFSFNYTGLTGHYDENMKKYIQNHQGKTTLKLKMNVTSRYDITHTN